MLYYQNSNTTNCAPPFRSVPFLRNCCHPLLCTTLGPLWDHLGTTLGPLSDHFGTTLGPLWDHFGATLGPLWDYFGTTFGPFWDYVGITLGLLWDHFGTILGPFWDHLGTILGLLWDYFGNCRHPLLYFIESEIIDRFLHSRCLNDCIDLPDMIGILASGANASLVAKNGTSQIIPLPSIKSSPVDRF